MKYSNKKKLMQCMLLISVLFMPLYALAVTGSDLLALLPPTFAGQKMVNSTNSKRGDQITFARAWYDKEAQMHLVDGTTFPGMKNKTMEILTTYRATRDAMNQTMQPVVSSKTVSSDIEVFGYTVKGAPPTQKVSVLVILKQRYILEITCQLKDGAAVDDYVKRFPLQSL